MKRFDRVIAVWIIMLAAVAPAFGAAGESSDDSYAASSEPSRDLSSALGLTEHGIEASTWLWLTYSASNQDHYRSFWSGEFELDLTKTFANRVSFAVDLEMVDYEESLDGNVEQLFTSILLSPDNGTILTIGKFNSPFGLEARDFWDRNTGTPSLLFRAQPQDLRGVMLTIPIEDTHFTLRPFVVSGFADEDYIPNWPSSGLMVQYNPNKKIELAVTGWIGPGIIPAEANDDEYDDLGEYYHSITFLTDSWKSAEFVTAETGQLYFASAHAIFKPRRDVTLAGEFLAGASDLDSQAWVWWGVSLMGNYDIDDHLRVFAMWSFLDDTDWMVAPPIQKQHEIGVGAGYRFNEHMEMRAEYRWDYSDAFEEVSSVSVHLSLGY